MDYKIGELIPTRLAYGYALPELGWPDKQTGAF